MPTIGQYLDNGARLQTKMVQGNDYLGQWGDVELLLVSNALVGAFDAYRTTGQGEHGLVEAADWEGFRGGSNRRPSVFQELYHPESTYLEKAPTPQLTRIDAADQAVLRAFNTHNKCTGVCRFVRGIPVGISRRVADLWGFCGAPRSPWLTRHRHQVPHLAEADDPFPSNPASPLRPARLR